MQEDEEVDFKLPPRRQCWGERVCNFVKRSIRFLRRPRGKERIAIPSRLNNEKIGQYSVPRIDYNTEQCRE